MPDPTSDSVTDYRRGRGLADDIGTPYLLIGRVQLEANVSRAKFENNLCMNVLETFDVETLLILGHL